MTATKTTAAPAADEIEHEIPVRVFVRYMEFPGDKWSPAIRMQVGDDDASSAGTSLGVFQGRHVAAKAVELYLERLPQRLAGA